LEKLSEPSSTGTTITTVLQVAVVHHQAEPTRHPAAVLPVVHHPEVPEEAMEAV
jgi:hypothetical protein